MLLSFIAQFFSNLVVIHSLRRSKSISINISFYLQEYADTLAQNFVPS